MEVGYTRAEIWGGIYRTTQNMTIHKKSYKYGVCYTS